MKSTKITSTSREKVADCRLKKARDGTSSALDVVHVCWWCVHASVIMLHGTSLVKRQLGKSEGRKISLILERRVHWTQSTKPVYICLRQKCSIFLEVDTRLKRAQKLPSSKVFASVRMSKNSTSKQSPSSHQHFSEL